MQSKAIKGCFSVCMVIAIATWHGVTVHTNIGSSIPAAQKYRQTILRLFSEPTTEDYGGFDPSWLKEQRRRRKIVAEVCSHHPELPNSYYDIVANKAPPPTHFQVSDKFQTIYCILSKTGSTSMRNLLLQLSGCHVKNMMDAYNHNLLHKSGLRPLTSYSKTGAIERLTNYTKFLIVRHPYERLHSAFTFQFIRWSPSFAKTFGTKIKKLYWKNPSKQQMKLTVHIRFEDFLRFVGNQTIPFNQRMDRHWEPYYHRSFPCAAKFDYILKMETLHEDTRNIIQGLFKNTTLQLPAFNMYNHTNITAYNDIPQSYMRAIWEVYKHDFELFDYRWPL